jgi:hypothetical protein
VIYCRPLLLENIGAKNKLEFFLMIQIFLQGDKGDTPKMCSQARPSLSVQPTHALLQPPPPQVLVIERIYSGNNFFF